MTRRPLAEALRAAEGAIDRWAAASARERAEAAAAEAAEIAERAAIMEIDGGLPRAEAEQRAAAEFEARKTAGAAGRAAALPGLLDAP